MIKAIIFDLDGVLVDTKKIHFFALNKALKKMLLKKPYHLKNMYTFMMGYQLQKNSKYSLKETKFQKK